MTPNLESCQLVGSITEAYETEGRVILRAAITGGSIDVLADTEDSLHLGDAVLLEGSFRLFSVRRMLDPESHAPAQDADLLS